MYLSLNWLKDYVHIPNSLSPEDLALKLTTHTVEIDGFQNEKDKFKNIVVGKILEVKKHPNADRLNIALVDVGKEKLSIVCGAPNIEKGMSVPVALVGAVLPNGMEIKKAEVRGEYSSGMLCAEDELDLGSDHAGIMKLEANAKIGQNLADYLKLKDVVFEVDNKSITNRPDLWGHLGMAREISVFLNEKTTDKFKKLNEEKEEKIKRSVNLEIRVEENELCLRYMALVMDNIKIGPSPKWMEDRLIAVGIRPINNIVDISNYVMMEFGQPMHAFDFNKVSKSDKKAQIIIRKARKNESIKTLDGVERKLKEDMLLIANKERALAVAGVMGGEDSEIDEKTSKIIFESANFNHISIRKTSTNLNLRTDASMRYEKSLDPNLCSLALKRAIELTKEVCPEAEIKSEIIDVKHYNLEEQSLKLSMAYLNKFLGFNFQKEEIINILKSLGFKITFSKENEDELELIIPSWRANKDIKRKEDIAEEIARIYSYDRIPALMPKVDMIPPFVDEEKKIIRKIKDILVLSGSFSEVYNYSFLGEDFLKKLGINYDDYLKISNPISKNHTLLRQSLIPHLFSNVKTNQSRFDEIRMFEIANVFFDLEGFYPLDNENKSRLPFQEKKLSFVLAGKEKNSFNGSEGSLVFKAKGVLENLFENLKLDFEFSFMENAPSWADKNRSAFVVSENSVLGFLAKLNLDSAKSLGIKKDIVVLELSIKKIKEVLGHKDVFKFKEFEKFPVLVRDLAFVLNEKIIYKDLKKDIVNFHEYIKNVELFDIFSGGKLASGKKSLAFHIIYGTSKTLRGEEVDKIQKELVEFLENKYEAQIRDF